MLIFLYSPFPPCIDAGDPDSDLDPDGTIADMGAYPFFHIWGCPDHLATNYDGEANTNDGSCTYPDNGDYSLSFDGVDDYVNINQPISLEAGNSASFVFWFHTSVVGEEGIFLSNDTQASNPDFKIQMEFDGNISVKGKYNDNNETRVTTSEPLNDGLFHQVVGISTGTSCVKLYIDGENIGEDCHGGANYESGDDYYIGRERLSGEYQRGYNGFINQFSIYNRVLSENEILDIYNANILPEAGIIASYNFNADTGDTLYDHSGNGNHGTIHGANWIENIYGCTDPYAENYDETANVDDGSCIYVYNYNLELHSGANLVSFYALPENNSVSNVLSSLGENATGVFTEGGASIQAESGTWVGSLTEIFCEKGYWVIVDNSDTLNIYDASNCDNEYDLHPGANLISFPSSGSADISDAIPDDIELAIFGIFTEGGAAIQISPYNWIGSLTSFNGGKGYWVISSMAISFSYDLSTLSRTNIAYKEEKLDGYEYVQSTKQAFYFIESIEGINEGDYILSFNGDKLIGSRQWQGSIIDVPTMGSDGNSYSSAYMKTGDTPTFKLLSGGKLTTLEGDVPTWSDNGLFMVSSLSQVVIPESYSLSQAYPNPFNPTTTLSFAIPIDSEVSLSIYNMQGREVSTLISGNMEAGYHSIVWDANSYASGVYFVKMVAGEFVNTQKLMLIK